MTDELEGAPETIWIRFSVLRDNNIRKWSSSPFEQGSAYTRKDIADKRIAELEAALGYILQDAKSGKLLKGTEMCHRIAKISCRALKSPTT